MVESQNPPEAVASENPPGTNEWGKIVDGRFAEFLSQANLKLPERSFNALFSSLRRTAGDVAVDAFLAEQKKNNYADLFRILFWSEIDNARSINKLNLSLNFLFERSQKDIKAATRKKIPIQQRFSDKYEINNRLYDAILKDALLPKSVKSVCEIGGAWGGTTQYFVRRFAPKTYHMYEIDGGWSKWLSENYGVESKKVDGETLSETPDASMDLVLASNCMFFMPPIKQWSYLAEMDRVLKPGGLAIFNVITYERLTIKNLRKLLDNHFPRRGFGVISEHCITTAMPQDRYAKVVDEKSNTNGTEIHQKRK
jgi:hypothetical protein